MGQAPPKKGIPVKRPAARWLVVPLWALSVVLYYTVIPFPPWVADTGAVSVCVLLLSYALGAVLQVCSACASADARVSIPLHWAARAVFLTGGAAVYILHGRPDELASLWALFLLSSRLRPLPEQAGGTREDLYDETAAESRQPKRPGKRDTNPEPSNPQASSRSGEAEPRGAACVPVTRA